MDPSAIAVSPYSLASMGIASLAVMVISFVVFILAWYKIFKKAGYPGWYVILMILPFVNLVIFLIFAFGQWPVLKGSAPQPPASETPQV